MRMAEYVELEKIINFLHKIGQSNTYSEFKPTFEEKVKRETYHENILDNASDLINKDIMADSKVLNSMRVSFFFHQTFFRGKVALPKPWRATTVVWFSSTAGTSRRLSCTNAATISMQGVLLLIIMSALSVSMNMITSVSFF